MVLTIIAPTVLAEPASEAYGAAVQVVVGAPMREFLTWLERCPRTYAEAMEAWRSSCPRYTVWEDALAAGLIQVDRDRVTLSVRGQALLAQLVSVP